MVGLWARVGKEQGCMGRDAVGMERGNGKEKDGEQRTEG